MKKKLNLLDLNLLEKLAHKKTIISNKHRFLKNKTMS